MRKNLLALIALLCCLAGYSQGVVVSTTAYGNANATQLVNNVLVNNNCLVQTANITKTTGLSAFNYAQGNSVGSFTNSNSAFPMSAGVVLVSGDANTASGPNTSVSSDNSVAAQTWLGDADLEAAFAGIGGINSMNATVLEFDFTAVTSTLSIPYLFASEEYGQYQCNSKDGMAILIKPAGGSYTNIATLPNGSPVSVATIRSNAYNTSCSSQNVAYFGTFNGGGNSATAATNFEGQTVLLTATYTLVPGTTYHLKIVVADDGNANPNNPAPTDGRYNSAVFLPAGSLNLGQAVVGQNMVAATNTALCQGESYTINTQLNPADFTFNWVLGSTSVGTGASYTATQSGTYTLTINNAATGCNTSEQVTLEFSPPLTPGTPADLYSCPGAGGVYTYNLSTNTTTLLNGANAAVSYHATQGNADTGASPLNPIYTTTSSATTIIYARIKSATSSCYSVVPFNLVPVTPPVANTAPTLQACETSAGSGTAVFNLTVQTPTILGSQSAGQYSVIYYTTSADANAGTNPITSPTSYQSATTPSVLTQTIYARVQSSFNTTCYAVTSFTIQVNPLPPLPALSVVNDIEVCGSYTLPTLPAGTGSYYAVAGGAGTPLPASYVVTTTQTIYIYNTNASGCSNQRSFTVTVLTGAVTPASVTACNSYTLPTLPAGQQYRTAANGGGVEIPGGTIVSNTYPYAAQTDPDGNSAHVIYFYIPTAASCTNNSSFTVTLITVPNQANVALCDPPYTLPALPGGGSYWTASGGPSGGGTQLTGNITTSQTIYIYNAHPDGSCFAETSFDVHISPHIVPKNDATGCNGYALQALTVGNYYTGPGGTGTMYNGGTIITTSQTLYIYYLDPVSGCSSEDSFVLTINQGPAMPTFPNQTVCSSYTLPAQPSITGFEGYYTALNGGGTLLPPSTVITSTTVLYPSAINAQGCRTTRQFTVTVLGANAQTPGNQSSCGSFTLPTLAVGNYYTMAGGPSTAGNVQRFAGDVLTTTQTLYVYATLTSGSTTCTADTPFTITILPIPSLGTTYNDVVACNSYTLPPITTGAYYSSPNGVGPISGTLTSTQVVYAYVASNTTPVCFSEDPFTVTIINSADEPQDVTACGSYTLPSLSMGSYRTAANGGGTAIAAGTVITSTQTIYRYIPVTSGANCTNDDAFTITITTTPTVDNLQDVVACNEYILPALTNGSYFSGPNGTGTPYSANAIITSSMLMYVYNANPGCSAQSDFQITINQVTVNDIVDQTVCTNVGYTLPDLPTATNISYAYYTAPGGPAGGGTSLAPGTVITTDSTIYIYGALTNVTPTCYAEQSFTVTTVDPPLIDDPQVIAECGSIQLPALTIGGNYFTGPGGTGNPMFAGQVITESTTLYIFAQSGGTPNCTSENEVQILVNPEPPQNLSACDSYTLPALPNGQHYYTAPGGSAGGGIQIPAGTSVSNLPSYTGTYATDTDGDQTHVIYFFVDSAAACTQDTNFEVTINETPVLDPVADVVLCDQYILPAISVGNYYTLPGGPSGGGQMLQAGDVLTTTQDVYVYAETATFPNCTAEDSFNVNITVTPTTIARSDVEVCDIYNLPALPAGYTYYSVSGGPTAAGQSVVTGPITPNAPDGINIFIYSAAAGNPNCFMETSFNVIVYSIAVDSVYDDIMQDYPWGYVEECDSYELPDIDEGDDTFSQHYYQLPGGPDVAGQVEIPDTTTITSSTTIYLYARLLGRVNCEDEAQIDIVINQTPVVDDSQADFSDCFTHTLPALAVGNYYSSPGGNNQITNLTITATQQIYIYAETGTNNICSDEHTFLLTINTIDVPDPADVVSCDDYTMPTPVPATARYFELAGGPNVAGQVEHFVGDVLSPGDYDFYVWDHTNTTPDCTDEEQFHIKVVARPVGIIPTALTTCSTDDAGQYGMFDLTAAVLEAIGTQQFVAASVHETLPDAEFNVNSIDFTNYQNVNAFNQTVYIRLYSTLAETCYTVVPLNLIVNPRPIATDPLVDYELCDNGADDNDGIGVFDLTSYIPTVLGGLDPTLHTVTFYPTLSDLENGGAIIGTPATFNTVTTTVYIKVTITATGCYDVVPLNLIVNPKPDVNDPTPLTLCDVNASGNEIEEFDLTSKINEITGGAFGLDVTFHTTLADAEGNTNAITNPTEYENAVPGVQPIFVRVTNAETGCYRIVLLDIRVEPLPILTPPTVDELTVCSTNATGYGNFDLDEIATQMIDGGANMTVQFYYTYVAALNNFSPITSTVNFQNNVQYNQTLYVVATNTITGCRSNIYTINLVVDPAPAVVVLQNLVQCDDLDGMGQDNHMIFDLTVQNAVIETQLGAAPGDYTIQYFTSQLNAQNGAPRITVPSAYYGTHDQVIWVRIENPNTDCYIVTSFKLKINQPQALAHPANIILCDDVLPNDNVATFDLTIRNDEILTPTGIGEGNEVRFFVNQADRDANINWITDPTQYQNIANPQTLYILVLTPEGCKSKETITIVVTPRPTPDTTPDALVLCDAVTIGDGIEVFDLTDAAGDILDGDTQSVIQYYATQADVDAGTPITTPTSYSNVTPWDDTVIVVVTRTDTQPGSPGCAEQVVLPLHVDPLPPVYDPADPTHTPYYAICNSPTTGVETFYLMDFISNLLTQAGENPLDYDIRFYANASDRANGIAMPHVYTNTSSPGHQAIIVQVTNNTTDCQLVATLDLYAELAAIANPVTGANNPLTLCDYDGVNDGFTIFDLTPAGTEALGTQSATTYSVQYYTTQAAAIDGDTTAAEYIGDLTAPTTFTNTSNPQTLWIRVTNEGTLSRCYDVTSFDVQVELLAEPVISTADGSHTICIDFDTNQPSNGPLVLNSGVPATGYTFTWFLDGADVTADPTENFFNAVAPGMYTVVATSDTALACVSNPSAQFEVIQSGPASLIGNGYAVSNAFSNDQTVVVLVEGYGEYQYAIAPEGEDPVGPWQNANIFENMPSGSFTVWVRDTKTDNPCDMVPIHGVSIIDYPNFFTPNGDGFNDYWNIVGLQNTDTRIFIFDRYGKLIKQLSPDSDGWDGTYNGNPLPADDYWFTVEYPDALGVRREFKSHFAMKR